MTAAVIERGKVIFGMSADDDKLRLSEFDTRLNPVGAIRSYGNSESKVNDAFTRKQAVWESHKVGSWASAATGSVDDAQRATARNRAKMAKQYGTTMVVSWHHEFLNTGSPRGSAPTGENGTSVDFWRMQERMVGIWREEFAAAGVAHLLICCLCINGWTMRPRTGDGTWGLTEAEMQQWFVGPNGLGPKLFGGYIGGDFYFQPGGNPNRPSKHQLPQFEAFAKKFGYTSGLLVGEYGAPDTTEGLAELDAMTDIFWRPGSPWSMVLYWNSDNTPHKFGLVAGSNRMAAVREQSRIAAQFNDSTPTDPGEPIDYKALYEAAEQTIIGLRRDLSESQHKATEEKERADREAAAGQVFKDQLDIANEVISANVEGFRAIQARATEELSNYEDTSS